jgi:branched-chain amino acid transport system ATP-binding protein
VLTILLFGQLSVSTWGRAIRAVRDSEIASVSIGLNPIMIRNAAFGISAATAGVARGVFASPTNFISPDSFPFFQSILFLLVVMVGGIDTELVMEVSSQVVVLDAGAKIAEGPPKQVATNDAVIEAYLGRSKSVDRKRVRALTLSPTPVLRAEDVWAGYGTATVLRDVTLHVNDGEVVAVIGANGAGKTTLTRVLTGLLQPTTGDI